MIIPLIVTPVFPEKRKHFMYKSVSVNCSVRFLECGRGIVMRHSKLWKFADGKMFDFGKVKGERNL